MKARCHSVGRTPSLYPSNPTTPFPKTKPNTMTTSKKAPNRGGRPRNPDLDQLQDQLAVSRRRAAQLLKEQKSHPTGTPITPAPLAEARLHKLSLEIERLQIEIENARLQQEVVRGNLVPIDEARELYGRPHRAAKQELQTMPKTLATRLYNQPQRAIEQTLAEWCDRLASHIKASI